MKITASLCVAALISTVNGWSSPLSSSLVKSRTHPRVSRRHSVTVLGATSAAASPDGEETVVLSPAEEKKQALKKQIRKEGGLFAFDTKYGALNPFGIYYGLTAILLGIPWFVALTFAQLVYKITGNRFDKLVSSLQNGARRP